MIVVFGYFEREMQDVKQHELGNEKSDNGAIFACFLYKYL